MASNPPPTTNTQINPPGTTPDTYINLSPPIPPIIPSVPIPPINQSALTQHVGTSSQIPFDTYSPFGITPGRITPSVSFPYNAPIHHTNRPIPSIPFLNLTGTLAINTPDLNTITQTLNLPLSNKEAMIKNIQTEIALL